MVPKQGEEGWPSANADSFAQPTHTSSLSTYLDQLVHLQKLSLRTISGNSSCHPLGTDLGVPSDLTHASLNVLLCAICHPVTHIRWTSPPPNQGTDWVLVGWVLCMSIKISHISKHVLWLELTSIGWLAVSASQMLYLLNFLVQNSGFLKQD